MLGGAIAARFAAAHSDAVAGLVLVDTLGLTDFDPAPEFGAALHAYLAEPSDVTHDGLWRHCARDLDAVRAAIELGRVPGLQRRLRAPTRSCWVA